MAKTKKFNSLEECIIRGTKDMVKIAERAKSVELTFKFGKDSVPTVSYKVDELPLVVGETSDDYEL